MILDLHILMTKIFYLYGIIVDILRLKSESCRILAFNKLTAL